MAGPFINDEEYISSTEIVNNAFTQLEDLFSRYLKELNSISTDKIVEGKTGDALQTYATQAAKVKKAISSIQINHEINNESFLTGVDTIDHELS